MKKLILTALVVCLVSPAWGDPVFKDGNLLHRNCKSGEGTYQALCLGYITGATDAIRGAGKGAGGFTFCPPEWVALGTVKNVVKNWLMRNPQKHQFAAPTLIAEALAKSYPCK